jgi:hypothetical protein
MSNIDTQPPERAEAAQPVPTRSPTSKHVRRFRKDNPRIDYYPSEQAEAAINELHKANASFPIRSIIDHLVLRGAKAISGNTQR